MKTDNIAYVGTLQQLGRPYAMLYVDKESLQLYLVVRFSEREEDSFLVAIVSPQDVEAYMNEEQGLTDLLGRELVGTATLTDGILHIKKSSIKTFYPTARLKAMNIFDPELCNDDVWIEIFLNRLVNNQPIEIA